MRHGADTPREVISKVEGKEAYRLAIVENEYIGNGVCAVRAIVRTLPEKPEKLLRHVEMEMVREIGRVQLVLWISGGRASRATFLHRVKELGLSALPADCRGSDIDKASFLDKEHRAIGGGRVFPQCPFGRERPGTDCALRPGQGECNNLRHKLEWPMLAYSIGYSNEESARSLCLHATVKEAQIGKNGRIVRGGFLAPALGMGPEKVRPPQPREVKKAPRWHELPEADKGKLAVEPSAAAFIARLIEEKEI